MIGNFNEEAQMVLLNAKEEMIKLGHPYIGTEHLLLSILNSNSEINDKLKKYNLIYSNFKNELCKIIGTTNRKSEYFLYTPLLRKVIENAIIDSKENNDGEVTINHLFLAILEEGEGIAIRLMIGMNIDIESLYDEFSLGLVKTKARKKKKLLLDELGNDITKEALEGKLDPVIGREKEVKRIMEILCRRTKNNPIIIGPAGVGKTAIVEELSRLIANDDVPKILHGKKIISLDMATLVAGTKYRGEFEERVKKILKEIEENDDIILFIDEIHTLVGAGGAEGAIDASNILKPSLARGKIRCIGSTTTEEYKKFIEKDAALERRFQKVYVDEPNVEETKNILNNIKDIYESYHNVHIDDNTIDFLVDASEKYIYDRNRPDKQIDILDEVCSKVSMKDSDLEKEVKNIRKRINKINKEKNNYIVEKNMNKAFDMRKEETILTSRLNELELFNKKKMNVVNKEDIALVISNRSGVPIDDILLNNIDSIKNVAITLKEKIIGHDEEIDKLIEQLKRKKYSDKKIFSILLVGPSGVGKTMLAKCLADKLVGKSNFIRLDMSEYSDNSSINKILGSSPGYVGYDDNRNILEEIRNKPNSIILLDEIDKASPSVINLFYQILDEGQIKDAKGNLVRFDNTIIIMTSNVGFERKNIGFDSNKKISTDLNIRFSSSFINRIDSIITFNELKRQDIENIIITRFKLFKEKYSDINIKYSNDLIGKLVELSEYHEYGARKLDKIISRDIENIIIDSIINNKKEILIESNDICKKNTTKS